MIKDLSVLEISMIDMVRAAIERFKMQFPERTPKFFYAPEALLHMVAKAALSAATLEDKAPPARTDVVSVLGLQLCYSDTNTIMVSDLSWREITGALQLNSWDPQGSTKQ